MHLPPFDFKIIAILLALLLLTGIALIFEAIPIPQYVSEHSPLHRMANP